MLMRLNIRHALPQIEIRNYQSRIEDSHMIPAKLTASDNEQARSNKSVTQARIDIDSYQSRHAYGATNMTDFARENGQRGISNVQSADSSHAQKTWSIIDNAAKRGNYIQSTERQKLFDEASKTVEIEAMMIPDPKTTLSQPSEVVGETDRGDLTLDIETTPYASIKITPGSAETHLKDEGFIRRWLTLDKYDIYA